MRILAIDENHPMPDRASGGVRFSALLECLAREHRVVFCAYSAVRWLDEAEVNRYRAALEKLGVIVRDGNPVAALRSEPFDAIWFGYYRPASLYTDEARFWQPTARILVDSVDVHFNRLFAKARLTAAEKDYTHAQEVKTQELATYRKADVVIAVSEEDRRILQQEVQDLPVEVIPNIHRVPFLAESKNKIANSLLFVGNFRHHPNVDAMLYFCKEILSLIEREAPGVRLTIVGNSPPAEVEGLARDNVEVLGFVPDIGSLLEASDISIAPLRYGGGIKGKIGEAMAYGLPVVTTSVGTEGFGLSPGQNVLVGNTPEAFASAVVQLIRDRELHEKVRRAAWTFVNERYSVSAVSKRIRDLFGRLGGYPVKKLSSAQRLTKTVRYRLDRHVFWRLRQARRGKA